MFPSQRVFLHNINFEWFTRYTVEPLYTHSYNVQCVVRIVVHVHVQIPDLFSFNN